MKDLNENFIPEWQKRYPGLDHGPVGQAEGEARFIKEVIGLYLISHAGMALFWLGLAGVLIGWGYSAPPLSLNSHGLGELSVLTGFALLPLGAAALAAWLTLRASLPQLDGELEARGLGDTATIERDGAGIPTITARTRRRGC